MLSMLSAIYGKIANIRNSLYKKRIWKSHDLGVRTISVGNITAGGTGKTPLVACIAEIFAARGEKVCILTRGYGREDPKERILVSDGNKIFADVRSAGDEPFELAQKLLGKALIVADADRVSAAEWALSEFGVTLFILDDGFQHQKAKRDIDIVCIDATDPFGGFKMIPSGRLREPLSNLDRADVVIITRANLVENVSELKNEIFDLNPSAQLFISRNKIARICGLGEFLERPQDQIVPRKSSGDNIFAFCGIGNPSNFFEQLRQENIKCSGTKAFKDHHVYSQADIINIEKAAIENDAVSLLTTAKDAVKLSKLRFELPCSVVEIEMVIDRAEEFEHLICSFGQNSGEITRHI